MIYSVRGTLIIKEAGLAVIECAGVGYGCRTTYNTLASLGNVGEEAMLYTYLQVREDGTELFGFYDKKELGCFKMLLGVSGVGPKVALSILSDIDPNSFALAVATGDHKQLTKVKGVGPKMAQRIVLELKDKLSKEQMSFTQAAPAGKVNRAFISGGAAAEAVDALLVLGYTQAEAEDAVSKLDPLLSPEELIRLALKGLAKFK
ncbi:MAG: Holliday junction branch migration protein RuvA [Oscillospiraceae bacterium]|nr:Holliday junction branch migration protein RuvA [Oscillospiraceae bacterium]